MGRSTGRGAGARRSAVVAAAVVAALASTSVAAGAAGGGGGAKGSSGGETALVDEKLTKPSAAFDKSSGGDVAVFEFSKGGMSVAAVNPNRGLFMTPKSLPRTESTLNAAVEATVLTGNKNTNVGLFCRRSEVNGGYMFLIDGPQYRIYQHDDFNKLEKLDEGTSKVLKKSKKAVELRLECERQTQRGFSMVMTVSANGKELLSRLIQNTPNVVGTIGMYVEGTDGDRAVATFRDLLIEELPAPRS